jgi:hypothetical protein
MFMLTASRCSAKVSMNTTLFVAFSNNCMVSNSAWRKAAAFAGSEANEA